MEMTKKEKEIHEEINHILERVVELRSNCEHRLKIPIPYASDMCIICGGKC